MADRISIDFSKTTGRTIKPLHGVNRPDPQYWGKHERLAEIGVPFARLHDVGGAFGRNLLVDIPNLFRDFTADVNAPESYDFTFTDAYIKVLVDSGIEPFFRLGVTIENFQVLKAYTIFPPKDLQKWAEICEHVVRHYTEGWANGFHYTIRYWEIWNEPDNPDCWQGTTDEFCELYAVASRHLKKCFPHLKIGGFASSGFYEITRPTMNKYMVRMMPFFNRFMEYVTTPANACPLDFFSFHLYSTDPKEIGVHANYARKRLDDAGFQHTELSVNEWNYVRRDETSAKWGGEHVLKKEMPGAAFTAAELCVMQDSPVDTAMYYCAYSQSGYCGLFYFPSLLPTPAFFALKAFNEVYKLKNEVLASTDGDELYVCASSTGNTSNTSSASSSCSDVQDATAAAKAALIVSNSTEDRLLTIDLAGVTRADCHAYILDADHCVLTEIPLPKDGPLPLKGLSVLLILAGKELAPSPNLPDPSICFSRLIPRKA